MNKKWILAVLFAGVATLFAAAGINAGLEECPDVITMKHEDAFEEHRMGIVDFTHTEHVEDYGYDCGECHHDENGEPTNDIACDEDVTSCITCHSEPGGNPQSSTEYYSGAIHKNCMDCHKAYNEETGDKVAPIACTQCHPRD